MTKTVCDLCGNDLDEKALKIKLSGVDSYHLPLGERFEKKETFDRVKNRFYGLIPMSTDLCTQCADKIHCLCSEIAEQNGMMGIPD